jgi:hypothetical protein
MTNIIVIIVRQEFGNIILLFIFIDFSKLKVFWQMEDMGDKYFNM